MDPARPHPPTPEVDEFIERIFPMEIESIRRTRAALRERFPTTYAAAGPGADGTTIAGVGDLPPAIAPPDGDRFPRSASGALLPDAELGLVGLAFSGGGIRSATFNLGVVQALAESHVLERTDYLSTVSGGGYIGATVSGLLNAPHNGPRPNAFPLHFACPDSNSSPWLGARGEPCALRHVRDHARYLTPRGLADLWEMMATLLVAAVFNFLSLTPYYVVVTFAVALILRPLAPARLDDAFDFDFVFSIFGWWSMASVALGGAMWRLRLSFAGRAKTRDLSLWRQENYGPLASLTVMLWATGTFIILQPAAVLYLAKLFDMTVKEGWGRIPAAIASTLAGTTVAGQLARWAFTLDKTWLRRLLLAVATVIGPGVLWLFAVAMIAWIWYGGRPSDKPAPGTNMISWIDVEAAWRLGLLAIIAAGVAIFIWPFVNGNRTSMHRFYRNKISGTFMLSTEPGGAVVNAQFDSWKLSDMLTTYVETVVKDPDGPTPKSCPDSNVIAAPYHLINAAVNLQNSRDVSLRGRMCDFFVLSKHYIGSRRTGYCATPDIERRDADLDVMTAISVSGAAAAPNSGAATNRLITPLMTLMNVRLGYWIPNPGVVKKESNQVFGRFNVKRLILGLDRHFILREMFGLLDEKAEYVYLSDGGHIENLAIYELLRRRCRLIIASDAEADPGMTFPSLARVIRYARTDLGVDIRMDVDGIRPLKRESGPDASTIHYTEGRIRYADDPPDKPSGLLIYIKSSLTGDEDVDVREQRDSDPSFPHTTTADQFFDEGQFECYRAVGYHIAKGASPRIARALEECDAAAAARAAQFRTTA